MKCKVEIDDGSGFCFGVVTAIKKAEEELEKSGTLYCIGHIVHNNDEVERLRNKGLKTISHSDLENLSNVKVLFRAHGEPPSTYETAKKNNVQIIDATCPVVLQLQKRIKKSYDASKANDTGEQIVIYGKHGHAEVNGLVGQTDSRAIVIEDESELSKIDFSRPVTLYSQTTKSVDGFRSITNTIREGVKDETTFRSYDTICRHVANRVDNLRRFARNHDLLLFVSDKKSSNGKYLYSICRQENHDSYFIGNETELTPDMLAGKTNIGICGATSTPRWLMEKVKDKALKIIESD